MHRDPRNSSYTVTCKAGTSFLSLTSLLFFQIIPLAKSENTFFFMHIRSNVIRRSSYPFRDRVSPALVRQELVSLVMELRSLTFAKTGVCMWQLVHTKSMHKRMFILMSAYTCREGFYVQRVTLRIELLPKRMNHSVICTRSFTDFKVTVFSRRQKETNWPIKLERSLYLVIY